MFLIPIYYSICSLISVPVFCVCDHKKLNKTALKHVMNALILDFFALVKYT